MKASHKPIYLIAALYISTFLCLVDLSSVNLALGSIQDEFHSDMADLQWVIDSYALSLSSLMLAVGAVSQRIGRKNLWLLGVVIFIMGSVICALASNFSLLIIGRLVQGVAGAVLIPLALAIIAHHFQQPQDKAREIGRWSSFSAFSLIVGPLMGGLMVHHFGWQSIFWLNLPVGLLTLYLGYCGIEVDRETSSVPFDYLGLLYSAAAVATLTYSIIALQQAHWGHWLLLCILLFVAATMAFAWRQKHAQHPLIPNHLFKNKRFLAYNAISFILGFAGYSSLFVFALFYQNQVQLSAAQTGWLIAPQFLTQAVVSIAFAKLHQRFAVAHLLKIGLAISGLALLAMYSFQADSSLALFIVCGALMGIGVGLIVPGSSTLIMSSVDAEDGNFAAAILNTLRQLGMTMGIAVLGTGMTMIAALAQQHGDSAQHAELLAFHAAVLLMGALFLLAICFVRHR
ncbi:MFS transporter [Acinetobacter larvae]|uniref:MFS transporter n=1 Tax=Acinetobacter larvae TaxID=1789224 RepID=A0A1B2M2K2_9GAMM|nr:MFS transporter [Acinetobacter larvae]AOA59371.1 MFS transporter [Acinetobacter larvae]